MPQCPRCQCDLDPAERASGCCPKCGMSWSDATVIRSRRSAASTIVPPLPSNPAPPQTPFSPEQIDRAWGALLSADLKPGMTIKRSMPAPVTGASGLRVPTREVVEQKQDLESNAEFELLAVLGTGGMGVVYEAVQTSLGRQVALKRIRSGIPDVEETRKAFLTEASVTGELDHPNIVPIYDLGEDKGGQLFYTMKKVGGTAWNAVLNKRSEEENLETLMRVADAVAFAHSRNVIHRDLKPENIMLGEFGEVLLMDWGLAASVGPDGKGLDVKEEHVLCGTPCYMAPEMARGLADRIGTASDVYLLGAILYEIIAGTPPHAGQDAKECLHTAAGNVLVPTDRSDELVDIARKAMASDVDERLPSVKAFQDAIRTYRTHVESNRLAARAGECLSQASSSQDYADYSKALFAYEEALTQWKENERAREGLNKIRLAYAGCARKKGDLELAESLLSEEIPEQAELLREIRKERRKRIARSRRLLWLSAAFILLLLFTAFLIYGSYKAWRKREREIAQSDYVNAIALAQRRIKEGGFDEARDILRKTRRANRHWEWGRLMRVCQMHELEITSPSDFISNVAYSPRGDLIFTAGRGSWQLWDAVSGEMHSRGRMTSRNSCYRFSPDGRYVHFSNQRFDTSTGLMDEHDSVRDAKGMPKAVSADGSQILVWNYKDTHIYRLGAEKVTLDPQPNKRFGSACFSRDGSRVLVSQEPGGALLYDTKTGKQVAGFQGSGKQECSLAISPSGERVMVGCSDGVTYIWKAEEPDSKPLELRSHRKAVTAVAFHPRGKGVATACSDGSARYWFQEDKKIRWYSYRGHSKSILDIAFSPGGSRLITGGRDGKARIWRVQVNARALPLMENAKDKSIYTIAPSGLLVAGQDPIIGVPAVIRPSTGEQIRVFLENEGGATTASISPDGKYLLVGMKEDLVLYNMKTGKVAFRHKRVESKGSLAGLIYAPNGRVFADHRGKAPLLLRDARSGAPLRKLKASVEYLEPVCFTPKGDLLLIGNDLVDVETGETRIRLHPPADYHHRSAISQNGRLLATCGYELYLWDAVTGQRKGTLSLPEEKEFGRPLCLAISADGTRVAMGRKKGRLTIWDASTGDVVHDKCHGAYSISHLTFDQEGTSITFAAVEGIWRRVYLADGTSVRIQNCAENAGRISDWRPDLDLAVVIQVQPQLRIWDMDGRVVQKLRGFAKGIQFAVFSPDSKSLLTTGMGYRTALWNVDTGGLEADLLTTAIAGKAAFSPDGTRAFLNVSKGPSMIWDFQSPHQNVEIPGMDGADDIAFSPDGTQLLTGQQYGNDDWIAYLYDAQTGKQKRVLVGHHGMVRSVAFSPDGSLLATGSEDRTLRLWNATSGEMVRILRGHDSTVRSIGFSSDGQRIVTGGYDSTVRVWETRSGRELLSLPSPLRHNEHVRFQGRSVLTMASWKAYVWLAADISKTPEELEVQYREERLDRFRYVFIRPKNRHFLNELTVTMEPRDASHVVRYTTDGSAPTTSSTRYDRPITFDQTTLIRAAAFKDGTSGFVSCATLIRQELLPARVTAATEPGLRFATYVLYYGQYESQGFKEKEPLKEGVCTGLQEKLIKPQDTGGVHYRGLLLVPVDGIYHFSVQAKRGNGMRLFIDGRPVLDASSVFFAPNDKRSIGLAAGLHRFEMTTYRYRQQPDIEPFWEGPDQPRSSLANAVFFLDPSDADREKAAPEASSAH